MIEANSKSQGASTDSPRADYPRPQLVRKSWLSLNGQWSFQMDFNDSGEEKAFWQQGFNQTITVPFCPESSLSGIENKDFMKAVWYSRQVQLSEPQCKGIIHLHFGAVDYFCKVWVNGHFVGEHQGGYTSFSFDITDAAKAGSNKIVVLARDNVRDPMQPSGKQSERLNSYGCFYTRTTGIWQTVWLEFLPLNYLSDLKMTTDAYNDTVSFRIALAISDSNHRPDQVKIEVFDQETLCASVNLQPAEPCLQTQLVIPHARLWSPADPWLYDIRIQLLSGEKILDEITSYVGLRTIEWKNHKLWLNGNPIFMRLILDQGFYPDGIYTAPSDQALVDDICLAKNLGFNGARLHEKVFEERYLYHCDRLGYLVWSEFPNWGLDVSRSDSLPVFLSQWIEVLKRDCNHPSIIGWCPFNETFDVPFDKPRRSQNDDVIRSIYEVTKLYDPTRPVIDTSGFYHVKTDIYDVHDYEQDIMAFYNRYHKEPGEEIQEEMSLRQRYSGTNPLFISEYGGTFWIKDQDKRIYPLRDPGWNKWTDPRDEQELCDRITGLTKVLLDSPAVCGLCYTQLTDVEQEVNGLYTYERKQKFSDWIYQQIKKVLSTEAAVEKSPL
ncbi:beta-galactosidase [Oscillospiraceae bacterium HV4-5-C5C]|nr:beta-galactosidase [Oscillospiraceae bacterium HV4-5-C5C]